MNLEKSYINNNYYLSRIYSICDYLLDLINHSVWPVLLLCYLIALTKARVWALTHQTLKYQGLGVVIGRAGKSTGCDEKPGRGMRQRWRRWSDVPMARIQGIKEMWNVYPPFHPG